VEWRTDRPLVGREIGSAQHRRLFANPKARGFRQGYGKATARSGRAMLHTGMACQGVVAIDLAAGASGGHGERSRMFAHMSVCAGERIERKCDQDDAGGHEWRQPLAPISPDLPSDHCPGDAHNRREATTQDRSSLDLSQGCASGQGTPPDRDGCFGDLFLLRGLDVPVTGTSI
jgi:hypothetical protein